MEDLRATRRVTDSYRALSRASRILGTWHLPAVRPRVVVVQVRLGSVHQAWHYIPRQQIRRVLTNLKGE